ncbi:MAG: outer membrane beta-barrel protein [Reyranellaceae bacterium]
MKAFLPALAVAAAVVPALAQQPPGQQTPSGQNAPLERRDIPPDEVPRGETVMGRPRPDYDPLGVRLGGFLLYPAFAVRQLFTSNVYATDSGTVSDFITVAEPSLDLRSNWNNHSLSFHADAAIGRYWDETSENYNDFNVSTAGRLDVTSMTQVFAGAGYRYLHEERSSPDDAGGREPTRYSIASAGLGVQQRFNRLVFRVDGNFDRYKYRDTPAVGGGDIDQSDRDRNETTLRLRGGYEFTPLRELYFLASVNRRNYDDARDNAGFDRDSRGFELAAGLRYDLSGVTFLDFYLGYSQQNYEDGSLKTARGPSGGLSLIWNVTRLTTVTGKVSREIEETTLTNASSYFSTKAELRVDHELLRNAILSGFAAYQRDNYKGIDRDDNGYLLGVSGRYLFDRHFSAEAGYTFRARNSNAPNTDYNENLIMLRLVGRL